MRRALLSAAARECVSKMDALSAAPLADTLMFPVLGDGRRQWNSYSLTADVGWRGSSQRFYLRSPGTPFDIVPLRPKDPNRHGLWYSIGPAFTADGSGIATGDLLLLQAEGPDLEPLIAELRFLLGPWSADLQDSLEQPRGVEWRRYCASLPL